MRCPKCQFDHELQTTECLKCGIVFARYLAAQEAAAKPPGAIESSPIEPGPTDGAPLGREGNAPVPIAPFSQPIRPIEPLFTEEGPPYDPKRELKYRALALPLALLVARYLAGTGMRIAVRMLSMVLHESGHAITCWLTGRWAVPMLWVTMHGDSRSFVVVLMVTAALGFGGYRAWMARRWGLVFAAGVALLLQLLCLTVWRFNADSLIVFFGDGGALVLATILMAMFYVGPESIIYKNWGLRWALLVIGALTFMDVYRTWSGPLDEIPFGELEGVNLSDPSLLTDMYGWPVLTMVDRYNHLAMFCLAVLAAVYVWGLASTYLETRSPASPAVAQ
ncbi:MAG TPA: hypothetical protein VKV95_01150 [Terriglobia bacterium]|nr:hypothetical protein [Terriglobia bacterium]